METKDLMHIVKKSNIPPEDELETLFELCADIDKCNDPRSLAIVGAYTAGKVMGVRQERQRRRNLRECVTGTDTATGAGTPSGIVTGTTREGGAV